MKLELGAGQRPTPGYIHNDISGFDDIDCCTSADQVTFPESSLDEVLALGVIEHLTYEQARRTFANTHRMLRPGGVFVFDVPDLAVWCQYLCDHTGGRPVPFELEHVLATLYGWQRWPGDEHKSGWTQQLLKESLGEWTAVDYGVEQFLARGHERRRMHRPADAHIYVIATK